jgi:hypothetical protein
VLGCVVCLLLFVVVCCCFVVCFLFFVLFCFVFFFFSRSFFSPFSVMRFSGANAVPNDGGRARVDISIQGAMRERSAAHKKEAGMLTQAFAVLKDAAVIFESSNDKELVEQAQDVARDWLLLMAKVDTNSKIINELHNGNQRDDESLTQFMSRRMGELESTFKPDSYKQHNLWMGMRQEIWNVHHEGELMPEQLENAGEDDVVLVRRAALTCPFTTQTLVDPVKNSVCGHVFSRAAAVEYQQRCKSRREQAKCPVVGCDKILKDLEDDPETARALAKAAAGKNKKRPRPMLNIQSQE